MASMTQLTSFFYNWHTVFFNPLIEGITCGLWSFAFSPSYVCLESPVWRSELDSLPLNYVSANLPSHWSKFAGDVFLRQKAYRHCTAVTGHALSKSAVNHSVHFSLTCTDAIKKKKRFVGGKQRLGSGCSSRVTRGSCLTPSDRQRSEQAKTKCMSHPLVQSFATCSMHHWLCISYGVQCRHI